MRHTPYTPIFLSPPLPIPPSLSHLLALGVPVPQLCDRHDRVQSGVLGERIRDDLQGVGERAETVGLHPGQRVGVLRETQRHLHLWSTAAGDQRPGGGERGGGVREVLVH